ncbi:hypothetical protein M0D21_07810 [Aquimarina sp. D1M17]|uniref:hypothetical protein n=1 Tax=Aquimarina acroporae TaxID=2937283 RepID=UPI0020BE9537|nr:hypothetical protein [Aquimarina acroporae]MCK8521468.1 hypothetical protein [Aquimarina acroporae]
MIDLNKNTDEIKEFLSSSINRFIKENQIPKAIGIYCCPWSGWITTNFNITKKVEETSNNCPDFEFVEFDFLELAEWESEYEKDNPEFKLNGEIQYYNDDLGDESLNEFIFEYLKPIVYELTKNYDSDFLLQMLDSTKAEII